MDEVKVTPEDHLWLGSFLVFYIKNFDYGLAIFHCARNRQVLPSVGELNPQCTLMLCVIFKYHLIR